MAQDHATQPQRLSSPWTPVLRTVLPIVSSVAVGAAFAAMAFGRHAAVFPAILKGAAIPVWALASWLFFKHFGGLKDVWLDGDDLLVDAGGRRVRISLREVTDIRQSRLQKTKIITLHLSRNTPLGEKVRFAPHFSIATQWADDPVTRELEERRARLRGSDGSPGELPDPTHSA